MTANVETMTTNVNGMTAIADGMTAIADRSPEASIGNAQDHRGARQVLSRGRDGERKSFSWDGKSFDQYLVFRQSTSCHFIFHTEPM